MHKKFAFFLTTLLFILPAYAQICPTFSLGPDTVLPCGGNLVLNAPAGYTNGNRLWSGGSHAATLNVTQAGVYWCRITDTLANTVVNAQFNSTVPGFTSAYMPGAGGPWGMLSNEGTYAITTNMNLVHNNFPWCFDHTSGNGGSGMLVVNGSSVLNQVVWSQNVVVQPNTNYIFSCWLASADPGSPAILRFNINGVPLGNVINLTPNTCLWQNFFVMWNSGANTNAAISLVNQNTSTGGNDFAVDDILFAPICVVTDTIHVQMQPPPVANVTGGDTLCAGDSITLTASSNYPVSVFTWNPGGQQNTTITISPANTTAYSVTATNGNCTSAADTAWVTLLPSLTLQTSGGISICPGATATLDAVVSGGWNTGTPVWNPGGQTGNTITVSPGNTTTYTCSISDACLSDSSMQTVIVFPTTILTLNADQREGCQPLCATFTAEPGGLQNLQWNMGNGTVLNSLSPTHCYTDAGTFDVSLTALDSNGCAASLLMPGYITVHPLPVASFTTDPGYIVSLDPLVQFTNTSSGADAFHWDFGDGATSTDENPSHFYLNVTNPDEPVPVELIVSTAFGCSDTVTVYLDYHHIVTFYLPNAFTPNGDGHNDTYFPQGAGISRIDAMVYNRWGELIFTSNSITNGWDGTDQRSGDRCPEGVYSYRVWIQDLSGLEYVFTERISLLR